MTHLSLDRPVERLIVTDGTIQWSQISVPLVEAQVATGCDLLISTYGPRRDGWLSNRLAMLQRSGFQLDRLFMATPSSSMPGAVCAWVNRYAPVALERRQIAVIVALPHQCEHWPLGFYSVSAASAVSKEWLVWSLGSLK